MKKLLAFILMCMVLATFNSAVLADAPIKVKLDNQELSFDVNPQIINGSTMVPLRKIFESLSIEVSWDGDTKTISGKKDSLTIVLQIDNPTAYINGREVKLDSPATIVNGSTLVPVRFIAESTGSKVAWEGETKTVSISREAGSKVVEIRGFKITPSEGVFASTVAENKASFGVFRWHIVITIDDNSGSTMDASLDNKFGAVEKILRQKYTDAAVEAIMKLVNDKRSYQQGYPAPAARVAKGDLIMVYRPANSKNIEILFADLAEAKSKGVIEQLKKARVYNEANAVIESDTSTQTSSSVATSTQTPAGKEDAYALKLQSSSQHFDYYTTDTDKKVIDDLSRELEANYTRITGDLKTDFKDRVKVYIYPDVDTYHKAIGRPDAPEWGVGNGGYNELRMVSPLNPGKSHDYQSLMKVIVHEFTHTATWNVRSKVGGIYKWLSEGLACYEAKQFQSGDRNVVKKSVTENNIPTLNTLETSGDFGFGDVGGYQFSYTIIDYMVNKHGMDKVVELIKAPSDFSGIFGILKEEFEKQWMQYLKDTYK